MKFHRGTVHVLLTLLAAVMFAATSVDVRASSKGTPYITYRELDLTEYLPPPPDRDSKQTQAEIAELLAVQAARTKEQAASAIADAEENVDVFWASTGGTGTPAFSPRTQTFFARLIATESSVVDPAKKFFARARPHMVEPKIEPIVYRSSSGSWPSGHSTFGWLMATVLADMVPEKRNAIFARAREYAQNRAVAGIHYPSDLIAGRQAGSLIALAIKNQADYRQEFEAARGEVRAKLGLAAAPESKAPASTSPAAAGASKAPAHAAPAAQ